MDNNAVGIWYKPEKLDDEKFYRWSEFEELLTRVLEDKLSEDIVHVYSKVLWVDTYPGMGAEESELKSWVETGM